MKKVRYRRLSYLGKKFVDYRVGSDGSYWSRKIRGNRRGTGPWRKMKPCRVSSTGRLCLICVDRKGNRTTIHAHVGVLESFKGRCPPGKECRHYPDPDPTNNNIKNLSWSSKKRNQRDRKEHGTDSSGERHGMSKLTWKKVRKIRRIYGTWVFESGVWKRWSQKRLAKRYGVLAPQISLIICNKRWKEEK